MENPTWLLAETDTADEIGIGVFINPFAPYHELFAEISDMRDRPARLA